MTTNVQSMGGKAGPPCVLLVNYRDSDLHKGVQFSFAQGIYQKSCLIWQAHAMTPHKTQT